MVMGYHGWDLPETRPRFSSFSILSCLLSDQTTNLRPCQSDLPEHPSFPLTHISTENTNDVFSDIDLLDRRWSSSPPHPVWLKLLKSAWRSVSSPSVQHFHNDAHLHPYSCLYFKPLSNVWRQPTVGRLLRGKRVEQSLCFSLRIDGFFWALTWKIWDNKTSYFQTETL